eukprot:8511219-Karenia_brevis.AAC.1
MPGVDFVCCQLCGNVHWGDRPCWPGFDGQMWVVVPTSDGRVVRLLAQGPQPRYDGCQFVLRCDGAAPGQGRSDGSSRPCGAGAVLLEGEDGHLLPVRVWCQTLRPASNNVAELYAMWACLQYVIGARPNCAVVESDSKLVVGWVTGTLAFGGRSLALRTLYEQARRAYYEASQHVTVHIRWISRN